MHCVCLHLCVAGVKPFYVLGSRTELMSFFLPNTYEDLPVISEESARYRHASCFFVDISFEGDAVQAILPFLDSSPSLSSETKNRQADSKPAQHSLHCVMSSKMSIRVVYPYDVLPHQRVSSTDIRFSLHELVVRSSLNDAVLLQSKSTKVTVCVHLQLLCFFEGIGILGENVSFFFFKCEENFSVCALCVIYLCLCLSGMCLYGLCCCMESSWWRNAN